MELDDFIRMSKSTTIECMSVFGPNYLRTPKEDTARILAQNEAQ
jgi:hypothetical protein